MNVRIMGWRKWCNIIPHLLHVNRMRDCWVGVKYCRGLIKFDDIGNDTDIVTDKIFQHRVCFRDFKNNKPPKVNKSHNNTIIKCLSDKNISFMGYISYKGEELSKEKIQELLERVKLYGPDCLLDTNYKYYCVINIGIYSYLCVNGYDVYATEDLNVFSSINFKDAKKLQDKIYLFSDCVNLTDQ